MYQSVFLWLKISTICMSGLKMSKICQYTNHCKKSRNAAKHEVCSCELDAILYQKLQFSIWPKNALSFRPQLISKSFGTSSQTIWQGYLLVILSFFWQIGCNFDLVFNKLKKVGVKHWSLFNILEHLTKISFPLYVCPRVKYNFIDCIIEVLCNELVSKCTFNSK